MEVAFDAMREDPFDRRASSRAPGAPSIRRCPHARCNERPLEEASSPRWRGGISLAQHARSRARPGCRRARLRGVSGRSSGGLPSDGWRGGPRAAPATLPAVAGHGTRVAKLVAGTAVIGLENQRQLGARWSRRLGSRCEKLTCRRVRAVACGGSPLCTRLRCRRRLANHRRIPSRRCVASAMP